MVMRQSAARAGLLVLRVAAGTLLFILVLAAIRTSDPRVAGMMLTFPALNGISLMLAPVPDKSAMARAMLASISLNGVIGLAYIEAVLIALSALGPDAGQWVGPLSIVAFAAWLAAVWLLGRLAPIGDRLLFRGFALVAPMIVAITWVRCPLFTTAAADTGAGLIAAQAFRIALFAASLALLLAVAEWLGPAHGLLGRLGAFPVLPLFSLATIAESPDAGTRLLAVRPALLLGLMLAMAFAWLYGRFLDALPRRASQAWWGAALAGLVAGWLAFAAIIFASMSVVSWMAGC